MKPTIALLIILSLASSFSAAGAEKSATGALQLGQGDAPLLIADIEPTLLPPISPKSAVVPAANLEDIISGEMLGLSQAFNETLLSSPRSASIRQKLGITKAAYAQALTFPNPSFLLYNGFRAEQTYQVGSSIPIEPPWKVAFRLLAARAQVKETDLEIAQSLWNLRNNTRRAYLDLVLAKETFVVTKELASLTHQLELVAERRFSAGDVAGLDVDRARLARSQADIETRQTARYITLAQQRLNVVLGRAYTTKIDVPRLPVLKVQVEMNELLPDFTKPVPELDLLVKQAIENRLDLKQLSQAIKANQAALKNTYGNIVPNAQVNIGSSITGNPPQGPKIHGYFVGITQELPVLNVQQGEIARFQAIGRQLKFEVNTKKNLITEEVVTAYQRVLAAREKIQTFQEHLLAESQNVARLARRSYEVGQLDITATLAAQQANVQLQQTYLQAIQTYQQALTDLEASIGTPL